MTCATVGVPDWLGNFQNPGFPARFYAVFSARYGWCAKSGGAIVSIATVHVVMTSANAVSCAAAKAAMLSLTRTTSIEGAKFITGTTLAVDGGRLAKP